MSTNIPFFIVFNSVTMLLFPMIYYLILNHRFIILLNFTFILDVMCEDLYTTSPYHIIC